MSYSIEPAFLYHDSLVNIITKASVDPVNKWFFADGCFSSDTELQFSPNTWQYDNSVVLQNGEILAYLESRWSKPLNIVSNFRIIIFNKSKGGIVAKAIFDYFDYIFITRGCVAFNWFVAEKNYHARRVYEKFTNHYFGHYVGKRHCGQMAYNCEVSDIFLYEITRDEYITWKEKYRN